MSLVEFRITCGEATGHTDSEGKLCGAVATKIVGGEGSQQYGPCIFHGSKALKGLGSPRLKSGSRSKHLPARYLPVIDEARNDEEILYLGRDLEAIEGRICELNSQLGTGEYGETWYVLKEYLKELEEAIYIEQDTDKIIESFKKIKNQVNRGYTDRMVWKEIGEMTDRRQRLVESERKRHVEDEKMVSVKNLTNISLRLVGVFKNAVEKYVSHDERISRKLLDEVTVEAGRIISEIGN